ncbi:MAG: PTS system mannose/fructose/sorbose family transporter subunit IID [Endomicrobium sp.]|jgi:PTS system mannose-specific IID component|nr:PTS system mannose/fructose/sorbose family transporter subunit IID [Endomicrobium sp.]
MFKTRHVMFIKAFFLQSLWNFERLQNAGFLFVLKPFFKRIYKDAQERKKAFLRHSGFFNTHPYMANIIIAMVSNVEHKRAAGQEISDVNALKSSLAGPLAAIGDSFFWGTVRPSVSFVCVFLVILFDKVLNHNLLGYSVFIPLFFLFAYNIIHVPLRYWFLFVGFKLDRESLAMISKLEFKFLWEALRYGGLLVIIAALFFYFKEFGFSPSSSILFGIAVPDAVVFAIVFVLSILLGRLSATLMFYLVILACMITSYLGI